MITEPRAQQGPGLLSGFNCFAEKRFRQPCSGPAYGEPQQNTAQNVGGPMNIEVQPGESRDKRQGQRWTPQGAPRGFQGEDRRESCRRMAGGEGGVLRWGDQQEKVRTESERPDSANEGL